MRFHSPCGGTIEAFFAAICFLSFHGLPSRAQDIPTPPDLWNIATAEKIPGADVIKTKDFGAIAEVEPTFQRFGRWMVAVEQAPGGLRPGDVVLAVDGLRIFGSRDFDLARFRDPLATSMTLLVNRAGDLQWIKYHDLQPGRAIHASFDVNAEQDRALAAIEALGLPLSDDKVRASLRQLPAQAAAELDEWSKEPPSGKETQWLQEFVNLFTAVQTRHYADAVKPAHEPPIPYFKKLEDFYLFLADENKVKEVPPDLKKSGQYPEFYTLALPVPDYQPPLGELKFSDQRFQALLLRKYALSGGSDPELVTAAQRYATSGTGGLDIYLGQVCASLLDPDNQYMLPFRSNLISNPVSGTILAQALSDQHIPQESPDWALNVYAATALYWATSKPVHIVSLVGELGKSSPYLARSAMEGIYSVRHFDKRMHRVLVDATNLMTANNDFFGPDAPVLYTWAVSNIQPIAARFRLVDTKPLPNPYYLLTRVPYAEMMALRAGDAAAAPSASPAASPSP